DFRITCQAQSGVIGKAGFSSKDLSSGHCGVWKMIEHTAVKSNPVRMDIGSRGGMIRTFNDLAERIVSDSIFQQDRDILRRTVVLWIVKACGVAEMRSVHSQLLRLLIHQFHKSLLRSRHGVRQGNTAFRS